MKTAPLLLGDACCFLMIFCFAAGMFGVVNINAAIICLFSTIIMTGIALFITYKNK